MNTCPMRSELFPSALDNNSLCQKELHSYLNVRRAAKGHVGIEATR